LAGKPAERASLVGGRQQQWQHPPWQRQQSGGRLDAAEPGTAALRIRPVYVELATCTDTRRGSHPPVAEYSLPTFHYQNIRVSVLIKEKHNIYDFKKLNFSFS